jgi:hypothetical protein
MKFFTTIIFNDSSFFTIFCNIFILTNRFSETGPDQFSWFKKKVGLSPIMSTLVWTQRGVLVKDLVGVKQNLSKVVRCECKAK